MKLPRPRIWLLMLVVAVVAVGSASWAWARKARRVSQAAAQCEGQESFYRDMLKQSGELRDSWASRVVELELEAQSVTHTPDAIEDMSVKILSAQEAVKDMDLLVQECRILIANAHESADSYRKAARYPWLQIQVVEPIRDLSELRDYAKNHGLPEPSQRGRKPGRS
jgi:hypothetical protein